MYEPTYCVLCGSSKLHKVKGKRGLFECVDCGGKFEVDRDGKLIMVLDWGDKCG